MHTELSIPDADWVALAETVSLTSAISPALLRQARIELHPELGPDAEGMVWMSALVERRTSSGIWLRPEAVRELRRRLRLRNGVDRAWLHLRSILAVESPLDYIEAELCYRGLSGRDHDASTTQLLRRLVVSAAENPGFAEWATRILPSLSRSATGVEGWALELIANTWRRTPIERSDEPPPELLTLPWKRLLPPNLPTTSIGVRREPFCLRFQSRPGDGFITLTVPKSEPVVVFVEIDSLDGQRALQRGIVVPRAGVSRLDVPNRPVRIRTLDHREFSLDRRPTFESDSQRLSAAELTEHLWRAAEMLRAVLDIDEYKHYVLSLVFYKRICDVWREAWNRERGNANERSSASEHHCEIPVGCTWDDVLREPVHIGQALRSALSKIEIANPWLRGVFAGLEFSAPERLPDTVLRRLLEHLDQHRLSHSDVDSGVLGDVYETLLLRFAEGSARKGGEFYTPRSIVNLMISVLRPTIGQTVYDPACGTGGALLAAVRYVNQSGGGGQIAVYGQEKNISTWAICKQSMLLHNIDDASIDCGDTLVSPAHLDEEGALRTFDIVLSNPPFSLRNWGHQVWSPVDPYHRNMFGLPPSSNGDFAFIQHMLASLNANGRMVVICPLGVLFRGGSEGRIRKRILEADLIEAVIGLGPNLFYAAGIQTALLLFNRAKSPERTGRIVIVSGESEIERGRVKNTLSPIHVGHLAEAIHRFEDQPFFCRVVELEEIRANDYNLSTQRYVPSDPPPPPIDLKLEASNLIERMTERDLAQTNMYDLLRKLRRDK